MHGDLSLARHIKFHYPGHQSQEPATQVTYSLTWISLQIQNSGFRLQGPSSERNCGAVLICIF